MTLPSLTFCFFCVFDDFSIFFFDFFCFSAFFLLGVAFSGRCPRDTPPKHALL